MAKSYKIKYIYSVCFFLIIVLLCILTYQNHVVDNIHLFDILLVKHEKNIYNNYKKQHIYTLIINFKRHTIFFAFRWYASWLHYNLCAFFIFILLFYLDLFCFDFLAVFIYYLQAGKYWNFIFTSYFEFSNKMSNNGWKLFCSARKRPIPYTRLTPFSTNSDTDSVISVHDSPYAESH